MNASMQPSEESLRAPFLTAEWRNLIVANYEIDAELLKPHVPPGTTLDLWNGKALVSLVAFNFLNTRVLGVPIPFHVDFEEINLRFYVKRNVADEVRRGVVFIKELVPRAMIANVARWIYNENYFSVPMSSAIGGNADWRELSFNWRERDRTHSVSATVAGAPQPLTAGSEAEFILEHFWGYTKAKDGGTREYRVAHPSWRAWQECKFTAAIDWESVYGRDFAPALGRPPRSAFVAEGSEIAVHRGNRI